MRYTRLIRIPILNFKTAEDTKALLKKTISPSALGIQVLLVRQVGNAGVVVQTTSAKAAAKITGTLPTTVPVARSQEIITRAI